MIFFILWPFNHWLQKSWNVWSVSPFSSMTISKEAWLVIILNTSGMHHHLTRHLDPWVAIFSWMAGKKQILWNIKSNTPEILTAAYPKTCTIFFFCTNISPKQSFGDFQGGKPAFYFFERNHKSSLWKQLSNHPIPMETPIFSRSLIFSNSPTTPPPKLHATAVSHPRYQTPTGTFRKDGQPCSSVSALKSAKLL